MLYYACCRASGMPHLSLQMRLVAVFAGTACARNAHPERGCGAAEARCGAARRSARRAATLALTKITPATRHGGPGLRDTMCAKPDAVVASGAAKVEAVLSDGPAACSTIAGPWLTPLLVVWQGVHGTKEVRKERGLGKAAGDLPNDFAGLPFVQAVTLHAFMDA